VTVLLQFRHAGAGRADDERDLAVAGLDRPLGPGAALALGGGEVGQLGGDAAIGPEAQAQAVGGLGAAEAGAGDEAAPALGARRQGGG
jgi:hypothetical protein